MRSRFKMLTMFAAGVSCATVIAPVVNKKHPIHKKQHHSRRGEAIIYTWMPSLHDGCIGHQSVLIRRADRQSKEQIYISFWPDKVSDETISLANIPSKFINADGEFRAGIQEDIQIIRRLHNPVGILGGRLDTILYNRY